MSKKQQPEEPQPIVLLFPHIEDGSIGEGVAGSIEISNHQGATTDPVFAELLVRRHGAMIPADEAPRRRKREEQEEGPKE